MNSALLTAIVAEVRLRIAPTQDQEPKSIGPRLGVKRVAATAKMVLAVAALVGVAALAVVALLPFAFSLPAPAHPEKAFVAADATGGGLPARGHG